FGYTGYQYDVYAGLWYAQARYYMPETGRFISEDPWPGDMTDPQTLNPYPYVVNNPLKYVDPLGLRPAYGVYSWEMPERDPVASTTKNVTEKNTKNNTNYSDCTQGTGNGGDKSSIGSVSEFKEKYGDIIDEMANELGVDPDLLAAVILVESSGSGFVDDNLKIRFENHIFVGKAGHSDLITHGSPKWTGHQWRSSTKEKWQKVHTGKQSGEYAAFEFALSIDEDAAYESISMGMGQIMGFNYKAAGYNSAKEMYEDFNKGNEQQLKGMITFFKNYNNGNTLKALQKGDLKSFVTQYNGDGQVEAYTNLMLKKAEIYKNTK
ncbi:N-acetylmuramidase domain-containing protein, partial [Lutispora sp.]|uniref:N-acetylmuramidase domain-containing protein n=1 Tax=Lutispora sp. TaxID=2828727 RepID=UPI003567E1BB